VDSSHNFKAQEFPRSKTGASRNRHPDQNCIRLGINVPADKSDPGLDRTAGAQSASAWDVWNHTLAVACVSITAGTAIAGGRSGALINTSAALCLSIVPTGHGSCAASARQGYSRAQLSLLAGTEPGRFLTRYAGRDHQPVEINHFGQRPVRFDILP